MSEAARDEDKKPLYRRWGAPRKVKLPEGYTSENDFLSDMRKEFTADEGADRLNRDAAVEDARFTTGDQWDAAALQIRTTARKPALTINRIPAFVAQLVGNRRLNDTVIKFHPDNGGTKELAAIREGMVRSIQKNSRAVAAYDKTFENVVIGGIGNFQIRLDWADDDVFEQDIRIVAIPNPMAVLWDRAAIDPTGADAQHCFVIDSMTIDAFRALYPDQLPSDVSTDTAFMGSYGSLYADGWQTQDMVRVVNYWRLVKRERALALMVDGTVQDVTDLDPEAYLPQVQVDAEGVPIMREGSRRMAQMWTCTGNAILEGPYELPISRLPVIRVPGWEVNVGEERRRWGLVRFLKDPMRLHNFWRSTIAERLLQSPKAKWLAADTAVQGRETEWRNAHLTDDNLLVFNADSGQPPTPVNPAPIEPGLVQEASMAVQDMHDVTNIHEAALGMQSNEVSGQAIIARQRVAELGSVIFDDNMNAGIEQGGLIINELIPLVYSDRRMVKVMGPDMKESMVKVNETEANDITTGKYSITVSTGPSYVTQRIEAKEGMLNMVNAMPDTMQFAADKIVEAQDWPGADAIAKRLRGNLPPGMVDPEDLTPEEQQAQQGKAQQAQMEAQIQQKMVELQLADLEVQIAEKQARARLLQAQATAAEAKAMESGANVSQGEEELAIDRYNAETDRMKVHEVARQNRVQGTLKAADIGQRREAKGADIEQRREQARARPTNGSR